MATKTLKFVTTVLKSMNKTEKDVQTEKVTAFVEDSTIECQQQISTLETSVLPGLRLKLKREQNNLDKANKNYETVKYSVAHSFSAYVSNREDALDRIDSVKNTIKQIETEIANEEAQLAMFSTILADLTA